jgi:hypothetical protein
VHIQLKFAIFGNAQVIRLCSSPKSLKRLNSTCIMYKKVQRKLKYWCVKLSIAIIDQEYGHC